MKMKIELTIEEAIEQLRKHIWPNAEIVIEKPLDEREQVPAIGLISAIIKTPDWKTAGKIAAIKAAREYAASQRMSLGLAEAKALVESLNGNFGMIN